MDCNDSPNTQNYIVKQVLSIRDSLAINGCLTEEIIPNIKFLFRDLMGMKDLPINVRIELTKQIAL